MTFLNQALLFGALAFSIPLILHILNRSRFKTIEWGATHLLDSVVRVNHKRFRLEQLILLLIRCAIPALLAFCLAQPVLTGARTLDRDAPVSMVVILDNSYSMDAMGPAGSAFETAVSEAVQVIESLPKGSEISVILTGGGSTRLFDQPLFDNKAVVRRLEQLKGGYGASDCESALTLCREQIAAMSHPRREVVVISDFQRADWSFLAEDVESGVGRLLGDFEIEPVVTLLKTGESVEDNVSVESIEYPTRAIGAGQQVTLRANIRNHGAESVGAARVILSVDGEEHSVSQVSLPGRQTTQTLFSCKFDESGSHVVSVNIVADDVLQTDNRYAASINVWDRIRVLLVDGDPTSEPLGSETDYLAIALTPLTLGRVPLADLVETEICKTDEISEEKLTDCRVVVLANVPKLQTKQLELVQDFTRNGGGLLVFAGNRIGLGWYAQELWDNGKGLLPMSFGKVLGKKDEGGASSEIVAQRFDHPALAHFNEPANGDLSVAEIRQWYSLSGQADATGPDSVIMARLASGDPLMVERSYGDGTVIQVATSCDADWSDLPLQPVFVPLVQQLITTLASEISPPRNIRTGDPAVGLFEGAAADVTLSMTMPDGSRRSVDTSSRGQMTMARFEHTRRPGVYTMSTPDAGAIHFVAESPRSESELDLLETEDLETVGTALDGSIVSSAADYISLDSVRRNGRGIWEYVLAAFIGLLFLEVFLQQRFARVRA